MWRIHSQVDAIHHFLSCTPIARQGWKNVVLFALWKTSLCRIGKIVILSHRKWPARANGQRTKIHLFSYNIPLSHFGAQAYVFTSNRPFYFEPIKRAPLRRRAKEDMRCFWGFDGQSRVTYPRDQRNMIYIVTNIPRAKARPMSSDARMDTQLAT